jgi:diguanylate cyclase (GGDEF)-like protein/PAS domain S-box-containing protein
MLSKEMYEALLDGLFEGVYFVDRDRRITFWNKAATRITGFPGADVIGKRCRDGMLCHVDDAGVHLCERGCPLAATMEDRRGREAHVFVRHADGHRVPIRVAAAPIVDDRGDVVGAVESFFEDSDWRESRDRAALLERYAFIDSLTELPNRRHLEQQLASKIDELGRYGWPCGVLLIDIDEFKRVNDVHGHLVGDAVLRMVARTLQGGVRSFDIVGRWGGEEFLAIVTNAPSEILVVVAERVRALVAASTLREPAEIAVTVSVGVSAARRGEPLEEVIRRADENLYRAKALGRNAICANDR